MARIALVKDGEPLPQFCGGRPLRVGNLAAELATRGHEVVWFTSTFQHQKKTKLSPRDRQEWIDGYRLCYLESGGYSRNISPARWAHHTRFAFSLFQELRRTPRPDLIVCCIPMLEAAVTCVAASRKFGVPVVLDIRDPWPEVFVDLVPRRFRRFARAILWPYFAVARQLFRNATSLTACSVGFLKWAQSMADRDQSRCRDDLVVYHGAHDLKSDGDLSPIRKRWPTASGVLRHVYLGAFGRNYDFETMVEVIEKLTPTGAHHFFFIGAGSRQLNDLQAKLQDNPRVTFTGWLDRADAYKLTQTCSLGWIPLRQEMQGFLPNKPFEYASLGLGVVVSEVEELRWLVDAHKFGVTFSQGDSTALLKTIAGLTKDARNELAKNARTFWLKSGDARQCAKRFADHLEMLLEKA
jgi:glycosyltransferase involved in cell wall biosynthesis